jgi:hypothetical protein
MYIHLGGFMDILNLQPPTIEWRVYRNDAAPMTVLLADSDGNALDLTDWDFESKVRISFRCNSYYNNINS